MLGEGNHQFGLKGELNSSWKSNERISHYGYMLVRCLNHPFKNCDDFVFEHRLIAEKYLLLLFAQFLSMVSHIYLQNLMFIT